MLRMAPLLISAVLLVAAGLSAQTSSGPDSPTVIFGTVAGDRGTTVSIPVYFDAGKTTINKISLAVDFISNSVKFDKADTGGAAEGEDITLNVQSEELLADSKGLPRTRLKIEASAPGAGSKPLPDGLWIFLNFRLTPDAKPFAVSLQPNNVVATGTTGRPVKVATEAGKVIVSAEDETQIGCFFFTH
ncbi:MAG: hypothetical protein EXQ56_13665 [Acidobacteria bacterium]|nr:hypothetical protein [Acidobacteriota bacterium]